MLDIGSLEVFLIIIIALLVIGPQRLPEVAKTLGQATGKFRRTINHLKDITEVNRYIQEFKDEIDVEPSKTILKPINEVKDEIKGVAQTYKRESKASQSKSTIKQS